MAKTGTYFTGEVLESLKKDTLLGRVLPPLVKRDPSDLSIGTGEFTQGIPAFWFARSVEYGSAENLYTPYADSPWVNSAIEKIAGPIASCELIFTRPSTVKVRRRGPQLRQITTARGIIHRAEEDILDLPQIAQWLKEPIQDFSYRDFVQASLGWLLMQECFWVLPPEQIKLPFPELKENPYAPIIIARPDRMRPTVEDGEITAWTFIRAGGKTYTLDPQNVVRLRGWNPYDEYRGLGKYRAAHVAAEADWLAAKFSRNLMANNGDTSRIIAVKGGQPTDVQRMQLIQEFKMRREASLRGQSKDVVVGGDVEIHNAELASVDPSFVAQRLENRHEVYIAFGVPPSMADIKASYSIGSASDMFQLLINTCIPTGGKYCGALEKLIYRMTGERVEVGLNWDEHPCMQEVRKERLNAIQSLAAQGMPMEEINEYLALGLVKYPGWDVGYIPINVQPVLNEQGEVNPAPMPGDFAEPGEDDDEPIDDGSETPEDGDAAPVKEMLTLLRGRCGEFGFRAENAENKKLWESHMRLRARAVKLYQGKASKVFAQYRVIALKHLAAAGKKSLTDIVFNQDNFVRDLLASLDPAARDTLDNAVKELHAEIGQPDDPWTMPPAQVKEFIDQRENLISGVGDTAFKQIQTTLNEGIDNGESMDKLAARLRAVFNNLGNYESKRIAMTETAAAYGYARNAGMNAAGIKFKSWLTSHGPTVRFAHRMAEEHYGAPAKAIPMNQAFIVGGEHLMYPGDPTGSPGNIINCHCIQLARQEPPKPN